jgi:hypothetical protein
LLASAVVFWQIVLAVHVVFVVAAFGLLLAYPLITIAAERLDRRSLPTILQVRTLLGRSLINPGLLVVVISGVYLAAQQHQWSDFYVWWGIAAAFAIGGLEGAIVTRQSAALAALAQRDVGLFGGVDGSWSSDYLAARTRADQVNALLAVIVVVTTFLMVVQ